MNLIKKIKQFINGSWYEFILDSGTSNLNLKNGEGLDSIVQKYSGDIDDTHYGNTNTGESAVIFGEANENNANRALLAGKLNENQAAQGYIFGLKNKNLSSGSNSIIAGRNNINNSNMSAVFCENNTNGGDKGSGYGSLLSGTGNENYGANSIVAGSGNKNYRQGAALFGEGNSNDAIRSIVAGKGNNNLPVSSDSIIAGLYNSSTGKNSLIIGSNNTNISDNSITAGEYCKENKNALLIMGNGTSSTPSNAFEVYRDGRAKVYGAPTEDEDVIRKADLDKAINLIMDDGNLEDAIDSFKDLQVLLGTDTTGAAGLISQVNENTEKINENTDKIDNFNLINGEGTDSLVQKYSGDVDDTHYGNTSTGESATVFGEANTNAGNRNLVSGKLNEVSGANSVVGGIKNKVFATNNSCIIGNQNEVADSSGTAVFGQLNVLTGNTSSSIVAGSRNKVYSYQCVAIGSENSIVNPNSVTIGTGLKAALRYQTIVGRYNAVNARVGTLFEVGNGLSDTARSNAFEVIKDGRAKIYGTPFEDNDLITVAYMKQYIKDNFATLIAEYLAENNVTAEEISTIFNREA